MLKIFLSILVSWSSQAWAGGEASVDAEIKAHVAVASRYGSNMALRLLAMQRVFQMREAKALCEFHEDNIEKCFTAVVAMGQPELKSICSNQAEPMARAQCLRKMTVSFESKLRDRCEGLSRRKACRAAADEADAAMEKWRKLYLKDAAERDAREARSNKEDTSPEATYLSRLERLSDSRMRAEASAQGTARGTR